MRIPSYYKKPKCQVLLVAGLGGLFAVVNLAFAQTWTPTSAPFQDWGSVASSADGTKLVAVGRQTYDINSGEYMGGLIYTSTDSGVSWTRTTAPSSNWSSVASSADGTTLVAVVDIYDAVGNLGFIYTST